VSIIPTIFLHLFLPRELTRDGGEEVAQRAGGNGARGDEVGQKEAEGHVDEVDGREEVGKVEDHDDHAVLNAHEVHLVRNDIHELHNDGPCLGHPC
jgi:hypothetical protein